MIFSKLVFPAPDAPMMKVAWPGIAEPVHPFRIFNLLSLLAPFFFFTVAVKETFFHVIFMGCFV